MHTNEHTEDALWTGCFLAKERANDNRRWGDEGPCRHDLYALELLRCWAELGGFNKTDQMASALYGAPKWPQ